MCVLNCSQHTIVYIFDLLHSSGGLWLRRCCLLVVNESHTGCDIFLQTRTTGCRCRLMQGNVSLDVQISSESENIHIFKIFGEWVMFVLAHFNSLDYKTHAGHNVVSDLCFQLQPITMLPLKRMCMLCKTFP